MSSIIPWGTWTSGPSLPSDVLARSHRQSPPPLHHCIMLHLHHIASASPLQGLSPSFSVAGSSSYFPLRHPPPQPPVSAWWHSAGGTAAMLLCSRGRTGLGRSAAAAAFDVKVALRMRKEYAMSPANRSGGEYISGRKSPAGGSQLSAFSVTPPLLLLLLLLPSLVQFFPSFPHHSFSFMSFLSLWIGLSLH